ncbi:hypothetical protein GMES_3454 [Paraglaciecola mesophila KMM 241]|uniref:Uncharacterized protein n=1 Tax=Paraglaciecola mesophila KMM 241 TaxID=1128912 RepID=K6YP17_9ALTE|nr:hypothetical protein GMES_3454 [Paraglaciecola mesophila KMM 241]
MINYAFAPSKQALFISQSDLLAMPLFLAILVCVFLLSTRY